MPYFIHTATRRVVVTAPGREPAGADHIRIDGALAEQAGLVHDQQLSAAQADALARGELPVMDPGPGLADDPVDARTLGRARAALPRSVTSARSVAALVEALGWILLVLAVLTGVIVAARSEPDFFGNEHHPHVGLGVAIAVGGAFQCLVIIMVAAYIKARMDLAQHADQAEGRPAVP